MTLLEAVQGDVVTDVAPRRQPHTAHLDPPTSPSRLLLEPLRPFLLVAGLFLVLAVAASVDGGSLLLHLDEPIGRFVVEHRTAWLDRAVRNVSFFGSTRVVLVGGLGLAIVAWPRCRMAAALIVAATLTRPPLEFLLKLAVNRDRPEIDQMVHGAGYSFPSGHPMAAATLWLMVPVVVSLYTSSRRIWVASTVAALERRGVDRRQPRVPRRALADRRARRRPRCGDAVGRARRRVPARPCAARGCGGTARPTA